MKTPIFGQYVTRRVDFLKSRQHDKSTTVTETLCDLEGQWSELTLRLAIVPGKAVLAALREQVASVYGVTLTDNRIIDAFHMEEIPEDLRRILRLLEEFRTSQT
jgi:hypothetical protein